MKLLGGLYLAAFLLQLNFVYAQVDQTDGTKMWYSLNLSGKINNRWSVSNFSLLGLRSFQHDFWFFQNNTEVNFKINRLLNISGGYAHSLYRYNPWWDRHYPQRPNFFNAVSFHSLLLGVQRRTEIGMRFQWSNEFIVQYYMPKFEKYETRFQYCTRLHYRKRDLPLGVRPFIQGALYYYLNGVETYYYDENYSIISKDSPDGLHRFRGKFGINFIPVKRHKRFSTTLYYGINREFNLKGFGNDQNIEHPSASGKSMLVTYPFNKYNIVGVQLGHSF